MYFSTTAISRNILLLESFLYLFETIGVELPRIFILWPQGTKHHNLGAQRSHRPHLKMAETDGNLVQ